MSFKRTIANLLIKGCGLRKMKGSRVQALLRDILDEIDVQHLRDSSPCPSLGTRREFYQFVHETSVGDEAIDYLEFGVFRGESMRVWVELNKHPKSKFVGFDSFEGLPEDWRREQGKGHFDVGGAIPTFSDPRVEFVKGWFENTIPPFTRQFSAGNRLIVHIDADLYSSAMLALVHFGPFITKGSLILFDEFYDRQHEFKALMDWQRIYRKKFKIVAHMENYGKICAEIL